MFSNFYKRSKFLFACAVVSSLVATAAGIENKPLPSFELQNATGSVMGTSHWQLHGKWVLIYLEGRCAPCTHLLFHLQEDELSELPNRTVIIVGGAHASDLHALQNEFPRLAKAKWYGDPNRNALKSLNLHGAPVTLGIEDGTLRWAISGIPPSRRLLSSVLKRWSAQPGERRSSIRPIPLSNSK